MRAQDIHLPRRGDPSPFDHSLHAGAVSTPAACCGRERDSTANRSCRPSIPRPAGPTCWYVCPRSEFGEGIALVGDELFQLTWQSNTAHVYDPEKRTALRDHRYAGEGWGLTTDGEKLYMSDGTASIYTVDPATFRRERRATVTFQGAPGTTSTSWSGSTAGSGPTSTPPTGS
ncbi:MAG: glutaminyl-peptide cyclotransferase [Alistipes senegalensis]